MNEFLKSTDVPGSVSGALSLGGNHRSDTTDRNDGAVDRRLSLERLPKATPVAGHCVGVIWSSLVGSLS